MVYARIERPKVITRFRVPYGHTDQMGHVYYGNSLLFFEMGRNEWMRAGGLTYKDFEQLGFFVPVTEAHVRYRGRIFYDDVVEIACGARREGRTRFRFEYEVRRAGEDDVLQDGWTVHAVVDQNGRPQRIPQVLLDLLATLGELDGSNPAS